MLFPNNKHRYLTLLMYKFINIDCISIMRHKIHFLAILLIQVSAFYAQTTQITSHKLNWKGVEKWSLDSVWVKVMAFENARYPTENRLPYFNQRVICNPNFTYHVELKNTVYVNLINEENELISGITIPTENVVNKDVLNERGSSFLDISVLPFINREGKVLKLLSFDLEILKSSTPQKVKSGLLHTYASSSVLAQGKFVKIRVSNSGVYKLTNADLTSMGINPANVRVFGYGGGVLEQSFLLNKIDDLPEVAIWNGGDYILFYAQGVNRWTYDKSKLMFKHLANSYSKYGYYFITSNVGTGKKIVEKAITPPTNQIVNSVEEFTDYQLYEKDLINLTNSGKEFYGETFGDVTQMIIPFSFPNPVLTNSTKVRLAVAASSNYISNFVLTLNGGQTKTLTVAKKTDGNQYEQGKEASAIYLFTPQTEAFSFNLTFNKLNALSALGYLNFLEVNTRRQLKMSGSVMPFQNVDFLGLNTYSNFKLSNANANVQIWDITDPANISKIVTQTDDGKLTFTASSNELFRYIAIDPTVSSAFPKPDILGNVPNQNLHGIAQADMVIITHPNFVYQAETLAQAHREKDNLTVAVVTTEQVYNEFSSGTPDATAYRWVMKMLYDRAIIKADMPKYLLLFGRGSFDNRKILSNSGDNLILTYQAENSLETTLSYVTDDYFAFLDDNEGIQVPSHLLDIGVGRFPVTTSAQAADVVNKTIGYINNTGKGNWKNQICFLADDGDATLHMKQADTIAVTIGKSYKSFQVNKIYLDAYLQEITASGQSYPLARSRFLNLIRSGLFLINYTGHAGATGWGNEGILSISDVKSLSNLHLPIFVGATCDFLQFDVQTVSAGEHVVLNPLGGGIGILSAARPVYADQNFTLNKLFCENLLKKQNGVHLRVGDVLAKAKNNIGTEINKLSYVYMGDPAIRLNFPTKYQVITSKVNRSTSFGSDTLRALSVATVQGFIADENGVKVNNFNGMLHAVVYDKIQKITTLNNENDGALTYYDRPNTLFSGNTEVKDGVFTFSFMLPKDIKYNYGNGRINYYAQDDVNDLEAQGYFESFIVGGADNNIVIETDGPEVQLFLNSENFISGDNVNETPLFMANINDINGINTVGSGIGHDLMLIVDQDPAQSYILNEYFRSKAGSYTEGVVQYKLPEMVNGKHTLTFRVWDLLNNSSTNSISFDVVKGLTPVIFSVSNYPNPVKTETRFVVAHDRPETILTTTVDVLDISGRRIWSFTQPSAENVTWNLSTNDGKKIKSGIYLYRVSIKTAQSDIYSKTNKMIIVEQ